MPLRSLRGLIGGAECLATRLAAPHPPRRKQDDEHNRDRDRDHKNGGPNRELKNNGADQPSPFAVARAGAYPWLGTVSAGCLLLTTFPATNVKGPEP